MKKTFITCLLFCFLTLFNVKAQDIFDVSSWQLLGYSLDGSEMEEIPGNVYGGLHAIDTAVMFAIADGDGDFDDDSIIDLYAIFNMVYDGTYNMEGTDYDVFIADVLQLPQEVEAQAVFFLDHDGDMDLIQITMPDGTNEFYVAQQNNPYALTYFLKLSEFLQDDTNRTPIARRLNNTF